MVIRRTSKNKLLDMSYLLILAPRAEKQVKQTYGLSKLELALLRVINYYQALGVSIPRKLIKAHSYAHSKNTDIDLEKLINKGYVLKVKTRSWLPYSYSLSETGLQIMHFEAKVLRQVVGNFVNS